MAQRLTNVDVCIEKIKQLPIDYDAETVQRCIEVLSNAPTIDAVPLSVVHKAAKKLAYIHQQIDLYGDRPDLHDEEYWYEYLIDEDWKDAEID